MTITIASATELARALSRAEGGETFVLAAGDYGAVRIEDYEFDTAVTIRSADPLNMARLTRLDILDSENIRIEALDIGRAMTRKEEGHGRMVSVQDAENISFDRVRFHGEIDGDPTKDGYGLVVDDSENVSVRNSEFTELTRGALFGASSKVVLEDNNFHLIRSDGANFGMVDTVLIKNNRFSDFHPTGGDHSDAIQFMTVGQSRTSSNITITGNHIFQGDGDGPQGIFLRDQTGRLPFTNVTIHNNILYGNDSFHGIAVLGGQSVSITNNTVVSRDDDNKRFWIKVEEVDGATIRGNVTDAVLVSHGVSGLKRSDNIELDVLADVRAGSLNLNKGAQTEIADLLISGIGYQPNGSTPAPAPAPSPSPAPAPQPQPAANTVTGTSGSDQVYGSKENETIYGFKVGDTKLGAGTRDVMFGSGGNDLFVLGDERGVFYADKGKDAGRNDYASIRDFAAGDRVQLAGEASDYVLKTEKFGRKGVSIYADSDGNGAWSRSDEFIAHVSGTLLPKNLEADYFTFG